MALEDPTGGDPFLAFINGGGTSSLGPQDLGAPAPTADVPWPPPEWSLSPTEGLNPVGGRMPGARDEVPAGAYATPGEWPPRHWGADLVDPREWTGEPAAPAQKQSSTGPSPDPLATPEADAISGVDGLKLDADAISGVGGLPPPPPPGHQDGPGFFGDLAGFGEGLALDAGNFGDTDPARLQNQLDAIGRADPERLARIGEAHKRAGDELALARIADEATKNRVAAEQNYKNYTQATERALKDRDTLMAESKKLAETKIDHNRAWARKSTPQKIAGWLLAIVGGLMQGRKGGPNEGLALIQKELDDDVEAQKAELAGKTADLNRRQSLVAQALGQTNDIYRAGEVARAAAYEGVIKEIDAQRQNYDPRGTAALRLANLSQDLRAKQAQAIQAHTEKMQKTFFEATKIDQEQQKIDIQRAEANAKAIARASRGVGAGGGTGTGFTATGALDEKTPRTPDQLAMIFGIGPDDPRPSVPMSMEQYRNDFLGAKHKLGEIAGAKHKLGEEDRKVALERTVPGVFDVDKDGKQIPFVPKGGDQGEVNKLIKRKISTTKLVNIMDKAMSIRTGWSSDIGKSKEWQELRPLWKAAVIEAKNVGELGVLAGPDMDIIEGWLGTDDPTRARGVEHAVTAARTQFVDSLRTDLQGHGLSADAAAKFNIPNPYANKPKPTPGEMTLEAVLGKGDWEADFRQVNPQTPEEHQAFSIAQAQRGGMTLAQKAALDAWGADLKNKPKGKDLDFAVSALSRAAKDAASSGVRDYAAKLLQPLNVGVPEEGKWSGGTGLTYQP